MRHGQPRLVQNGPAVEEKIDVDQARRPAALSGPHPAERRLDGQAMLQPGARPARLAAALTGLATGVGAFPFFFVRALPRRVYDGILGLGAGLMLAAATLGLLGEALAGIHTVAGLDAGRLALVVAGFVSGVG